jgi:phage host-nuclease inhibitor protein Gam
MRTTKVFTAKLRKDLNENNWKGKTLRLEFELNDKVAILSNNDWAWQIDTIHVDEVEGLFEDVKFLKTNVWQSV